MCQFDLPKFHKIVIGDGTGEIPSTNPCMSTIVVVFIFINITVSTIVTVIGLNLSESLCVRLKVKFVFLLGYLFAHIHYYS